MKIIGLDGKEYQTEKECLEADAAFEESQKKAELEEVKKKNLISKRKKELSDVIKSCDAEVEEAEKKYRDAREEASRVIKEANAKAEEILKTALIEVDKAREKRMLAIGDFNKEFGAYTTTYTGDRALQEYNKFLNEANKLFEPFFNRFWF